MKRDCALETVSVLRKSAQEVEIDNLLAEEFYCEPAFAEAFLTACGLACPGFRVLSAVAEPSLGGQGFGDLLVDGIAAGLKVALLIEDKITAGPAVRQAERYSAYADVLRTRGWDRVWTILVAPASYQGERAGYDANTSLEKIASILNAADPVRLGYRRGIITRALEKKASAGVRVPDTALHRLKSAYLDYAVEWFATRHIRLVFPGLRPSYYDGDSWIVPIRGAELPSNVMLRHRFWTSTKAARGMVDLIISPASSSDEDRLRDGMLAGAYLEPYSKRKGFQVSLPVPEMRQNLSLRPETAASAFQAMEDLIRWYSSDQG